MAGEVYEYVNGSQDGTIIGYSATNKIAFFGGTPIARPSGAGQAAVSTTAITTAATSTTPWGFATSTQADNLAAIVAANRTLINQLRSDLSSLNLIKGSA